MVLFSKITDKQGIFSSFLKLSTNMNFDFIIEAEITLK